MVQIRTATGGTPARTGLGWLVLAVVALVAAGGSPAAAQQPLPAQDPDQQQPEALEAGQLPTEADVLLSPEIQGWPVSIEFVGTDIRDVVRFFSQITGLNIIVHPDVTGRPVTLNLHEVPWDIAFESVLQSHRLGFIVRQNVVRVATLSTLADEAEQRARLAEQEEAAAPLRTVTINLSYARAQDLSDLVTRQLTERGDVIVEQRTNALIVKDTTDALDEIQRLIDLVDVASPQVMIESRIVETSKDFSRELGIQWGFQGVADGAHGNTTGLVFPNDFRIAGHNLPSSGITARGIGGTPFAVNLPASDASSGVALTLGSILDSFRLDLALSAMERDGRGKIISTPKVTAQNNFEATIESGQRIPIQTLVDNTASVQFINANLQLRVVPQITEEDTVMLDITVDKSEPDFSRLVVGIPTIFTRKAETRVLVRDGGTTVIGGIFQMTVNEQSQRVPFLHRVPLLGNLFKSEESVQTNTELLIFITPTILEQ